VVKNARYDDIAWIADEVQATVTADQCGEKEPAVILEKDVVAPWQVPLLALVEYEGQTVAHCGKNVPHPDRSTFVVRADEHSLSLQSEAEESRQTVEHGMPSIARVGSPVAMGLQASAQDPAHRVDGMVLHDPRVSILSEPSAESFVG
jgi:hypothetical protein